MNIKGFKVNFLGDSITEGVGVADIANCRYDNRLAKLCQLSAVNNYGVSGTRLAHQFHASPIPRQDLCFCGRAYDMDTTADMVVVYGGINDYLHGDAPFGEIGDTAPTTFCGGVYFLMHYLRETYAGKTVIFMTPARCFYRNKIDDLIPSAHERKHTEGKPLRAYVDVILQTAKRFDIPVLNLYEDLAIDPHNSQACKTYTVDGLHFNDAGHAVIAKCLNAFIKTL